MQQHSKNALELAEWLATQDEVSWVNYPGLSSSKHADLAKKYLPNGHSGIVTFGLKGGFEAAKKAVDKTRIFSLLANIARVRAKALLTAKGAKTNSHEMQNHSLFTHAKINNYWPTLEMQNHSLFTQQVLPINN